MKRFILFGTGAVIIVVLVGMAIQSPSDNQDTQSATNQPATQDDAQTPLSTTNTTGMYIEYSESAVDQAQGTKILFFHASWCPQCRALDADIKAKGVPANTTIFKVDYDNAQDLRKKYGVTLQTTVVKIDDQGKLVSKFVPYQEPTLNNALSNL